MSSDFAHVVSPVLAGIALKHWTVDRAYLVFGLAGAMLALSASWLPGMRRLLALEHAQADGWYGRTHPQVFASGVVSVSGTDEAATHGMKTP